MCKILQFEISVLVSTVGNLTVTMATVTKTFFVDGNEHYSSENMRMRRRNTFDTVEPKKHELTITSCK